MGIIWSDIFSPALSWMVASVRLAMRSPASRTACVQQGELSDYLVGLLAGDFRVVGSQNVAPRVRTRSSSR